MRAADNVGDIITATQSWTNGEKPKHPRKDNIVDFARGKVLILAKPNKYEAETVVGTTSVGEYVLYDVAGMEPADFKMKEEPSRAAAGKDARRDRQEGSSSNRVAKNNTPVNRQHSVSSVEDGKLHLPMVEPVEEIAQDAASGETDGRLRLPMVQQGEKLDNGVDSGAGVRYNEIKNEGGGSNGREMGDDIRGRVSAQVPRKRSGTGVGEHRAAEAALSAEGNTAGDAGQDVLIEDNEGRRLTQEQMRQLRDTAITDESGAPLAVYHF